MMILVFVTTLLSLLVVVCVCVVFNGIEDDYEDDEVYSRDRIEFIKNKYKELDNIKKMKQATKEDVERFYKEQENSTF